MFRVRLREDAPARLDRRVRDHVVLAAGVERVGQLVRPGDRRERDLGDVRADRIRDRQQQLRPDDRLVNGDRLAEVDPGPEFRRRRRRPERRDRQPPPTARGSRASASVASTGNRRRTDRGPHFAHSRPAIRTIPRPFWPGPEEAVARQRPARAVRQRHDRDLVAHDGLGAVVGRGRDRRIRCGDRLGDGRVELGRAPVAVVVRGARPEQDAEEVVPTGIVGDPGRATTSPADRTTGARSSRRPSSRPAT